MESKDNVSFLVAWSALLNTDLLSWVSSRYLSDRVRENHEVEATQFLLMNLSVILDVARAARNNQCRGHKVGGNLESEWLTSLSSWPVSDGFVQSAHVIFIFLRKNRFLYDSILTGMPQKISVLVEFVSWILFHRTGLCAKLGTIALCWTGRFDGFFFVFFFLRFWFLRQLCLRAISLILMF